MHTTLPSIEQNRSLEKKQNDSRNSNLLKATLNAKPLEQAMEMWKKVEEIKQEGMEKLIKHYLTKIVDERTKPEFQKTFRFLFGSEEGGHAFLKLIMEKKVRQFFMILSIRF